MEEEASEIHTTAVSLCRYSSTVRLFRHLLMQPTLTTPPPPTPPRPPGSRLALTDKKVPSLLPTSDLKEYASLSSDTDDSDDIENIGIYHILTNSTHDNAFRQAGSFGLFFSIVYEKIQLLRIDSILRMFLYQPQDIVNSLLYTLDRTSIQLVAISLSILAFTSSFIQFTFHSLSNFIDVELLPQKWRDMMLNKVKYIRSIDIIHWFNVYMFNQANKIVDRRSNEQRIDLSELYCNILILMYGYGPTLASNITPTSIRFGDLILKPPSWKIIRTLFQCFDFDQKNGLNVEQFQLCNHIILQLISIRIITQTIITWLALQYSKTFFSNNNIGHKILLNVQKYFRISNTNMYYHFIQTSVQVSFCSMISMFTCHNCLEIIDTFYEEMVKRNQFFYLKLYKNMKFGLMYDDSNRRSSQSRRLAGSLRRCSAPSVVSMKNVISSPSSS